MNAFMERIKSIIAVILSLLAVIVPVSNAEIAMEVEVSCEPMQTVRVEWVNKGLYVISEPRFYVEQQVNGEWETVAFAPDFAFPEIYTSYLPLQGDSFTVRCEEVFGKELEPGTYRFNFQFHAKTADGLQSRVVMQEFVIAF